MTASLEKYKVINFPSTEPEKIVELFDWFFYLFLQVMKGRSYINLFFIEKYMHLNWESQQQSIYFAIIGGFNNIIYQFLGSRN